MGRGGKEVVAGGMDIGTEKAAEPTIAGGMDNGGKATTGGGGGMYTGAEKDSEPTVVAGGMNVEDSGA